MNKKLNVLYKAVSFSREKRNLLLTTFLFLFLSLLGTSVFAQNNRVIKGVVLDEQQAPVIGATVVLKSNNTIGVTTDIDGNFSITVPAGDQTLVISFVGMEKQEINVTNTDQVNLVLKNESVKLEDVVVVGYGKQKAQSVVGSIVQTTGKTLERAGGVTNLGSALTGNLPGVVTMSGSGVPGEENPTIIIRAATTWNVREPLVLVDGIERPMSSVDISSVQSISVLKDASATAVFGVKGANGVILITTKRGKEGVARIEVSASSTIKVPSKLPNKLDSYDALMARNVALEHELGLSPSSWEYIRPQSVIEKYRYPADLSDRERYPNVDWQDELFKDYATSYTANLNVSGGGKFVKYFASADFANEGDLFDVWDNGRGYKSGFGYNRLNVRSNLDFQVTKTTVFKVNLSGSNGVRKSPSGFSNSGTWAEAQMWAGAYSIAPDAFLPKYSDGSWGFYPNSSNVTNSAANLSLAGAVATTNTRINTDFTLEQSLDMIIKGLSAKGTISWDNAFQEGNRGINDTFNDAQLKWIDPETGISKYKQEMDKNNKFDFMEGVRWSTGGGQVNDGVTNRNLYYQMQLNWAREFGKHNVTAMGLFSRSENASTNDVPVFREDWAFRSTYNFASKYFIEYNGAYNGSERFAPEYRFGFFNSGAIGWTISEESFMKSIRFLDNLKLRASYGEIGDDNIKDSSGGLMRFLYQTKWGYADNISLDLNNGASPYTWYRVSGEGNPDVRWETVKKLNVGVDFSFLNGLVAGSAEVFRDKRVDILVGTRAVPSYYGTAPPIANIGEVKSQGFEIQLRFNKTLNPNLRIWADFNMTHAKSTVLERDDPRLYPAYQKQAGFSIGQTRTYVDAGYINNYDQLYGSPQHNTNDDQKLPGDYYIIDFNGDGVVDSEDNVPYGYSDVPQNTYNATIGFEWKGLSAFVQFYGVNNVTREVSLVSFPQQWNTVYDMGSWWSAANPSADVTVPRFISSPSYNSGTQYLYDGSYIRLKNAEIAYTFKEKWISKIGFSSLRVFVNGNNLWIWSKMPDDRESNMNSQGSGLGAYPMMRRYNFGLKFTL